jgi:hypothetical protein
MRRHDKNARQEYQIDSARGVFGYILIVCAITIVTMAYLGSVIDSMAALCYTA